MKDWLEEILLYIGLVSVVVYFGGCDASLVQKPKKQPIQGLASLPIVDNIVPSSDFQSIALAWDPSKDYAVKGYFIYRRDTPISDFTQIARIDDRHKGLYVDKNLKPNLLYEYQIVTYDEDENESNFASKGVQVSTLKPLEPTPMVVGVSDLPRKVKIYWRPHPDKSVSGYIIKRLNPKNNEFTKIATTNSRYEVEYIDKNLPDDTIFSYVVVAKTFDGIESMPSEVINVKTKPLPLPVLELKASSNVPKQIVLTWLASTQSDADYYRIYRSLKQDGGYEPIAKLRELTFVDTKVGNVELEDGKPYYYKISVVDKDGLESMLSPYPTIGRSLQKPNSPKIKKIEISDGKVSIEWEPVDERSKTYVVRRTAIKLLGSETSDFVTQEKKYIDQAVVSGQKYTYQILSLDEHNLASIPSEIKEITIPSSPTR